MKETSEATNLWNLGFYSTVIPAAINTAKVVLGSETSKYVLKSQDWKPKQTPKSSLIKMDQQRRNEYKYRQPSDQTSRMAIRNWPQTTAHAGLVYNYATGRWVQPSRERRVHPGRIPTAPPPTDLPPRIPYRLTYGQSFSGPPPRDNNWVRALNEWNRAHRYFPGVPDQSWNRQPRSRISYRIPFLKRNMKRSKCKWVWNKKTNRWKKVCKNRN